MTARYWAFLSYSHADETAAGKLHRALESYVLPRRVRKAHALPRRLIPIFRDVDELAAASGLTTRLQDALDQSQWLIVLCSPAAAQSKYVNAEIDYFVQKHGANRILCALVQGEPPECFPLAIKALVEEPLAADFRPGKDFELSKLKLIAALAGVGFTELRSREAQRRKRQQLIAAALVAGVALSGLAYWDLFHREHVDYYVNYVRRHGIWEGVDRISAETASHRSESHRFTRQGRLNPPGKVELVNGYGECAGDGIESALGKNLKLDLEQPAQRYCSAVFAYSSDGSIRSETLTSRLDIALESLNYNTPELAQLTQDGFAAAGSRGGIYYVQFVRDDQGRDLERRFLHSRGVPRANNDRAYGYRFQYDEAGRLSKKSALDGASTETGEIVRFLRNGNGQLTGERYEDANGQARIIRDGYSGIDYTLDGYGNTVGLTYLGPDGSPVLVSAGFAGQRFQLNEQGLALETQFSDVEGKLVTEAAILRLRFDSHGNIIEASDFDATGQPTTSVDGVSAWSAEYDQSGNPVEVHIFDAVGKPAIHQAGHSINRKRFDKRGNLIEQRFFDINDQPINSNYGHVIRTLHDARNNVIERIFLDVEGKPFVRPDRGYSGTRVKYDDRGNQIELEYLGRDGTPAVMNLGFAYSVGTFDDQGNRIESRYLDEKRRPVAMKYGQSIIRKRYDRLGNDVETRYYDETSAPAKDPDGGYGYNVKHDRNGRPVRVTAVDATGSPMMLKTGYATVTRRYDELGNEVESQLFDTQGRPLKRGLVREVHRYDQFSRLLESRGFDAAGRPAEVLDHGCPIHRREYDTANHETAQRCLSADKKPYDSRKLGWASKRVEYEHGRVVKEEYFDAAGRQVKPKP